MLGENHSLLHDFPEHQDIIIHLNQTDPLFAEDNTRYTSLDKEIRSLEQANAPIDDQSLHQLKHQRSELKDALYQRIVKAKK